MGVVQYEDNGNTFYKVIIHLRSKKNRKIRVQKKFIKILTRKEADEVFLEEYRTACEELGRKESEGLSWGEVLEAWELWYRKYPSSRWDAGTVKDYLGTLYKWTSRWLKKPASALSISDGFQLVERLKEQQVSTTRIYQIKTAINVVYKWGILAGKITDSKHSPMFGIELKKKDDDTLSEILSRDQVAVLLSGAENAEHEWAGIWRVAAYTGMRSGELEALRKSDIELVARGEARRLDTVSDEKKTYGFIRVQRQWNRKLNGYGPTKGRMARTVPVSGILYWFLVDFLEKNDFGTDEHGARVFPLLNGHRGGRQAEILKLFCASKGFPEIKFHTFRACFATHLLAAGVEEIKVMKVGGWKDRETMMAYVRRAGVDEAGATEKLNFEQKVVNTEQNPASNVVSLFVRR